MEHLFKILIIGDIHVGKTSLVNRYVHKNFTERYRGTVGVDFALKELEWTDGSLIRLQLWDIAGQERFGLLTHVYYREADACVIVFDVTNPKSFQAVSRWKSDLDSKVLGLNGLPIPCILLANKCDLEPSVSHSDISRFVRDNCFVGWMETSARTNKNIHDGMALLIEQVIKTSKGTPIDRNGFKISRSEDREKDGDKQCAC
eukprot:TRINITY_DN14559_c0_g1_i1.p1 TRINITY_DN14559_c0_g1~~TRINITY_DN14559_c0_g1_i1.p1  ORF type:complete len:202 (-),score=41.70 TRINITY_DN14559_c0_g1_i1:11-616(-)